MDIDTFDRILSAVDIVICIVDMSLLVYLIRVGREGRVKIRPYPKFEAYRKGKSRKNRR